MPNEKLTAEQEAQENTFDLARRNVNKRYVLEDNGTYKDRPWSVINFDVAVEFLKLSTNSQQSRIEELEKEYANVNDQNQRMRVWFSEITQLEPGLNLSEYMNSLQNELKATQDKLDALQGKGDKYDKLKNEISAFYSEDENDHQGDLLDIGELVTRHFGFL